MVKLTLLTDDMQFLLWLRVNDHFQHDYDNAHRIHAQAVLVWRRGEQLREKYMFLHRWYCIRAYYPRDREWLDFHHTRTSGISKLFCDLGNEKVCVSMAIVHGRKAGIDRPPTRVLNVGYLLSLTYLRSM